MKFPSFWDDPIQRAYLSRLAQMDIGFQQHLKRMKKRLPLFWLLRQEGGSGFRMANSLRHYFVEFNNRIASSGPRSLPSSFNVVQGFLKFDTEFAQFDLRRECEHLLRLQDYFDWYTSEQGIPDDPRLLIDALPEGEIYSYDMVEDTGEYTMSTEGSRLAILGVSFVRHQNELSIILLTGENPPNPPDEVVLTLPQPSLAPNKKNLSLDESLSIKDRYIEGMPGYARILLLTRLNLVNKRHDVRYINLDLGQSYEIYTDDEIAFDSDLVETREQRDKFIQDSISSMERYNQLFSALSALIYLPIMFVAENDKVIESQFTTNLGISTQKPDVKKAGKEFGRKALPLSRTVRRLSSSKSENRIEARRHIIQPPDFKFETTGYWKPIAPNEIGEDKNGNPIMGQTWVERRESYSIKQAESFTISYQETPLIGNDPGTIYIMRNPAQGNDLYKVGITRRTAGQRAAELTSSTASPLSFEVLASWEVGDCSAVEREVHSRLKPYRINRRREFFLTPLSNIVNAIQQTIADEQSRS